MRDNKHPTVRTITLSSPVPSEPAAALRLRGILRKALQDALTVGLTVGMLACSSGSALPLGGQAGDDGHGNAGGKGAGGTGGGGGTHEATGACAEVANGPSCASIISQPHQLALFDAPRKPDYLVLRSRGTVLAEAGQRCDQTADPAACQAAVDGAGPAPIPCPTPVVPDGGFGYPQPLPYCPPQRVLVTRTGNQVEAITDATAAAELLAPINNTVEAIFLASFWSDVRVVCEKDGKIACEDDAFIIRGTLEPYCGSPVSVVEVRIPRSGSPITETVLETRPAGCAVGRLPDGYQMAAAAGPRWDSLPRFLVDCAGLEAASIPAFFLLAQDLETLGAPAALVQAARASAMDEIRHAAALGAFARDAGADPIVVNVPRRAPKSLFAMARENAVEGCVRETYGAVVAGYQAATAGNVALARELAQIAEDERRHATLAHAIAAWAEPQLDPGERQQIAAEQREAIAQLRAGLSVDHADDVHEAAGLPRAPAAWAILDTLEQQLWAAPAA